MGEDGEGSGARARLFTLDGILGRGLLSPRRWYVMTALVVLVAGSVATFAVRSSLLTSDAQLRQERLEDEVRDLATAMRQDLDLLIADLEDVRNSLMVAPEDHPALALERAVELAVSRGSSRVGNGFSVAVATDDVRAHLELLNADPVLDGLRYPNVPTADRDAQPGVVVSYLAPLFGRESAIGIDFLADPVRAAGIVLARDRGETVATTPVVLRGGDNPGELAILLLAPLYDRQQIPTSTAVRRQAFLGVLAEVVPTEDLLAPLTQGDLAVAVADVGAIGMEEDGTDLPPLLGDPASFEGRLTDTTDVIVGDRRWRLTATPADPAASQPTSWLRWGLPITGVLASLLLAAVVLLAGLGLRRERSRRVEGERHRDELREAHDELREAHDALTAAHDAMNALNAQLERRVAERTEVLASLNHRLEHTIGELERFVYAASHDLRTPLTTVMGSLSLLQRRLNLGAVDADLVARALRGTETMRDLISGLIDHAQRSAAGGALSVVAVDDVVVEALDQLADRLVGRGIEIERETGLGLVTAVHASLLQAVRYAIETAIGDLGAWQGVVHIGAMVDAPGLSVTARGASGGAGSRVRARSEVVAALHAYQGAIGGMAWVAESADGVVVNLAWPQLQLPADERDVTVPA